MWGEPAFRYRSCIEEADARMIRQCTDVTHTKRKAQDVTLLTSRCVTDKVTRMPRSIIAESTHLMKGRLKDTICVHGSSHADTKVGLVTNTKKACRDVVLGRRLPFPTTRRNRHFRVHLHPWSHNSCAAPLIDQHRSTPSRLNDCDIRYDEPQCSTAVKSHLAAPLPFVPVVGLERSAFGRKSNAFGVDDCLAQGGVEH